MRRDLGQPADVFSAVLRGEAEVAVEAGPQGVAVEQDRRAAAGKQPPLQRARQGRLAGAGQPGEPDHRTAVAVARRTLVRPQRRFHGHDIGRNAPAAVDRQHQATAGNAAVDLDHQPSGARIVGIGIGGDRLRQRDLDLADMVARDRGVLRIRQRAGIDRFLDRNHLRAGLAGAEPDQNLLARSSGLSCSQKIRARRRRASFGLWPTCAMMSPRSMKSSRSSVMPTERPAPCLPATGVTGQLSTDLILAILPAGMMTISSPLAR